MGENNKYVKRISLSLPPQLVEKFDMVARRKTYWNRSKAVGDALREWISQNEWREGRMRVGVISILYNHETRGVVDRITEIQHRFGASIIASTHVHLSRDECLEVIVAKGKNIPKIANSLSSLRGVKRCNLTPIS